jgi:hypothetical protein
VGAALLPREYDATIGVTCPTHVTTIGPAVSCV